MKLVTTAGAAALAASAVAAADTPPKVNNEKPVESKAKGDRHPVSAEKVSVALSLSGASARQGPLTAYRFLAAPGILTLPTAPAPITAEKPP